MSGEEGRRCRENTPFALALLLFRQCVCKLYSYCIAASIRRSNSILLQFHCNNDTAKSNYTRLQASTMGFMRLQHHRLLLIRHNQQWKETTLYVPYLVLS